MVAPIEERLEELRRECVLLEALRTFREAAELAQRSDARHLYDVICDPRKHDPETCLRRNATALLALGVSYNAEAEVWKCVAELGQEPGEEPEEVWIAELDDEGEVRLVAEPDS